MRDVALPLSFGISIEPQALALIGLPERPQLSLLLTANYN